MLQHLTGGLQQGLQFGQNFRRNQQLERGIDYELGKMDEEQWGRRGVINRALRKSGQPEQQFYSGLGDPFIVRIRNWFRGRRANRQQQPMGQDMGYDRMQHDSMGIPMSYRDGGSVDRDEAVRRATENRARTSDAGQSTTRQVQGRDEFAEREARQQEREARQQGRQQQRQQQQQARASSRTGKLAGAARRGVNAAGRVAAAPALAGTAISAWNTPTEQYRERFGIGPSQREGVPQLLEDVGIRALGAASDLGNMLTLGTVGDRFYRDLQPKGAAVGGKTAPAPEPEPEAALPMPSPSSGTAAPAPESTAPPAALPMQEDDEPIDWADVQPAEVPNMTVDEWAQYRAETIPYLLAQGMTESEAHLEITKVQQQGFMRHLQEAEYLLAANQPHAAAAAARAAFQYFPNGADVQFGVYGDSIVGMGVDEKTGQPRGKPMPLNRQTLGALRANFENPMAFLTWTTDWQQLQQNIRAYEEVDRPQAQAQAQYQDRMGRAALMNAYANQTEAAADAAGRGRTQADFDRANAAFRQTVETIALDDEQLANRLASAMSQIYVRSNWQYPQVIEFIQQAHTEGRLDEVMQELGL